MTQFATDPGVPIAPMTLDEMEAGLLCGALSIGQLNWMFNQLFATVGGPGPVFPIDIDPTLAANSDVLVASQKAVKTYIAAQIAAAGADASGHVIPAADNAQDLGSNALRWRSVKTATVELSSGSASIVPITFANAITAAAVQLSAAGELCLCWNNGGVFTPGLIQKQNGSVEIVGPVSATNFDNDAALTANSASKIPTQQAVKAYVDAAVVGLFDYKGATDCSSNPNYPAALKGDSYAVSVAGKIGGASGQSVAVGDLFFAKADNAGGTEASVGANWDILRNAASAMGGTTTNTVTFNNSGSGAASGTAFNGSTPYTISYNTIGAAPLASPAFTGNPTAPTPSTLDNDTSVATTAFVQSELMPSVQSVASASTFTPVAGVAGNDAGVITALAANLTVAAPTGTAVQMQPLILRIKDNGTARTLTWNAIFRAIGVTLPTTTVIGKTLYVGFIYNATDSKWDCVLVRQEA